MNLFSKLSTWYFSRKALPYWSIILLDCLVILFSGLLVYALNNGIFATMGIFWHLSLTWGVCLVPYLVGFRLFRTYSGIIRYSSFVDLQRVGFAVLFGVVCVVTIGYLLYLSLSERQRAYLLIGLFALGSIGFLYSSDYVFDNILEPHQQIRIKVVLGMEEDLAGAGYNVNQSKIAIGSGGLTGKGFLNGTQTKLKYVPEQDTDFIFCTVGEEQGFVGSAAVLLLFLALILRLIATSERQTSTFGRVYGYSVVSIFLFHLFINIGMVLGLTPVIGIPLPFFSYGGSSLWGFTILLFIFLRIDAGRSRRL